MAYKKCALEHGIIFIFDPGYEGFEVPEYDEMQTVSYNDHCLSVRGVSYVDGEVNIGLNEPNLQPHLIKVFDGSILTPKSQVSIVNSLNETLIEAKVSGEQSRIRVLVDDVDNAEHIEVQTFRMNGY